MTRTFKKTEKQRQATKLMAGSATNIMLYGGSRSGKTFQIVRSILIRACKEKSRHVSFRHRFNHAKTSLWLETIPKVLDLCFPNLEAKPVKSDYYYLLPNGSEYWIAGLDDKERTEKVLGKEYSTIHFNECSQIGYDAIQIAKTRLAEKNGLAKKTYYDENPPRKTHWSYWNFIRKVDPNTSETLHKPEDFASMLMNPIDNIENIDEDYIENVLNQLPSEQQKRFKYGHFLENDGGFVYYGFNRENCHTEAIYDPDLPVIIGQDFNRSPMASAVFQKRSGIMHQVDELFLTTSDTPEVCRIVAEKFGVKDVTFIPDATGSRRTSNSSRSDHQIIREFGFKVRAKRSNPSRVDRYAAVNRAFEKGLVRINCKKCPKTIKDLETISYREGTNEPLIDDPMKGHIADALGYAVEMEHPITGLIKIGSY